jgi:hypothetical protein
MGLGCLSAIERFIPLPLPVTADEISDFDQQRVDYRPRVPHISKAQFLAALSPLRSYFHN